MRTPTLRSAAAFCCTLVVLTACRATYAPRTPVTGVDRPYPDTPAASAADAAPDLFTAFMADLVAERELAEDVEPSFAIFPAFSENRDVGPSVNGMGVALADQTRRLIEISVPKALVFTGDQLQGELRRNGIEPGDLCSLDDVVQAAPQLGVSYVVYGSVNHTVENALEGLQSVSIRWSCLRLDTGQLTALVDEPEIRGEAATGFIGNLAQPTNWSICRR